MVHGPLSVPLRHDLDAIFVLQQVLFGTLVLQIPEPHDCVPLEQCECDHVLLAFPFHLEQARNADEGKDEENLKGHQEDFPAVDPVQLEAVRIVQDVYERNVQTPL